MEFVASDGGDSSEDSDDSAASGSDSDDEAGSGGSSCSEAESEGDDAAQAQPAAKPSSIESERPLAPGDVLSFQSPSGRLLRSLLS